MERAAINAVRKHFEKKGYAVESVESEACGWDLTAIAAYRRLHIEVKGRSGSIVCAELTPNEYRYFHRRNPDYRFVIVTDALKRPKLHVVSWNAKIAQWTSNDGAVSMSEKVGAIIQIS